MAFRVNSFVEIIGVNVNATKEETTTAPAITTLNSRNKRPVVPSKKTIGKNTATNTTVVAITAKNISFDPLNPACNGDIPCSIFVNIFSMTTIASSTTKPMASTTASKVKMLMVNPATYIIKKEAINDTGIARTGINVVRQLRKKRKMIKTTKRKASKIVSSTSLIELRMNTVLSKAIVASISSGRSFSKSCITR